MSDIDDHLKRLQQTFEANKGRHLRTARPDTNQRLLELARKANCPRRHWLKTVRHEGEWGTAYQQLKKHLGTGTMIALVGGRGGGKTQLAVELIRANLQLGRSSQFTTATAFFMDIKASYKPESRATEKSVIDDYCKPELLVVDEIGKRGETEWEYSLLFELLNRRYNCELDIILIDNRPKADFVSAIGESLASRMNECGGIKECNWPSYRN